MKTPITDAIWDQTKGIPEYHAKLEEAARRLETDRAALMEECQQLLNIVELTGPSFSASIRTAKEALAAARANFPES